MTRIIIIGEGQTEQSFCNDLLAPFFIERGIYLHNTVISKSGGGIVSWASLKKEVTNYLKQDTSVIVTTFIDYYGIKEEHGFPKWKDSFSFANKELRIECLEQGMFDDIDDKLRHRFIPYIQLHEFEGLLFCQKEAFDFCFEPYEFNDYAYLLETIQDENPENINDGKTTAPSKRLERILKGYKKPLYGSMLAQVIGLNVIRSKCPRFNNWMVKLSDTNKIASTSVIP